MSSELLAALSVTLGTVFFLHGQRTDQTRNWLASGVFIGLGALSHPIVLFVGLALSVSLLPWKLFNVRGVHSLHRVKFRPLSLFTIAFALMVLPWGVRNYAAFGRPVVGSTLAGYNLFRQNYMLPTNNYLRYVGPREAFQAVSELVARRTDLRGTENEAQMEAVYQEEAMRIIAAEPKRYIMLSAYRFLPLWFNWGVKEAYRVPVQIGDYLIFVQQGFLLVTAVLGLYVTWRRSWLLGMNILVVTLLHMAVISQLRYLIIVMPLTVTLSAIGLTNLPASLMRYLPDR